MHRNGLFLRLSMSLTGRLSLAAFLLHCCGALAAVSPSVAPAVELNTLWEITLNGTDSTSTVDSSQCSANPPCLGLFYLPVSSSDVSGNLLSGVEPLYLLLNPAGDDHMDSVVSGEGGYTTESTLGYVWTGSAGETGLAPVVRMYDNQSGNAATGDHATAVEVAPLPHWESLAYHVPEGAEGYAYARFPGTDSVRAGIAAGAVFFNVNLAVGCAGWEWWWNHIEFINDYDYGRQMQITMSPADGSSTLGEAGDQYGGPAIAVDQRHPSPCVQYSNDLSSASPSLTTASVPLEWNPSQFGGGPNNPVIYPSVSLGKTITLNWVGPDGVNRNWPVALFQTTINSPTVPTATVEAPTGYLNAQFNTYYYYNPVTKVLSSVPQNTVYCSTFGADSPTPPSCNCAQISCTDNGYDVPTTPGETQQVVILADGAGNNADAMAVYINDPNSGFVLYDNSLGGSGGQFGSNFVKWEVHYYSGISAGTWTYKTWVMTDTLQNVLNYVNQLYAWNVSSR